MTCEIDKMTKTINKSAQSVTSYVITKDQLTDLISSISIALGNCALISHSYMPRLTIQYQWKREILEDVETTLALIAEDLRALETVTTTVMKSPMLPTPFQKSLQTSELSETTKDGQ